MLMRFRPCRLGKIADSIFYIETAVGLYTHNNESVQKCVQGLIDSREDVIESSFINERFKQHGVPAEDTIRGINLESGLFIPQSREKPHINRVVVLTEFDELSEPLIQNIKREIQVDSVPIASPDAIADGDLVVLFMGRPQDGLVQDLYEIGRKFEYVRYGISYLDKKHFVIVNIHSNRHTQACYHCRRLNSLDGSYAHGKQRMGFKQIGKNEFPSIDVSSTPSSAVISLSIFHLFKKISQSYSIFSLGAFHDEMMSGLSVDTEDGSFEHWASSYHSLCGCWMRWEDI